MIKMQLKTVLITKNEGKEEREGESALSSYAGRGCGECGIENYFAGLS
jgi:hypothetical protein